MANVSIILGKSGTGKSTSIKGLNPEETVVLNTLKKRLPFKGSSSLYNEQNKNLFNIDDYTQVISILNAIGDKAIHIKNVIIDDSIYIMRKEFFKRAKESGYGKFTELAQHFQQIIATAENLRSDLNIFFILHSEEIINDKTIVGHKVSTVGKLLEDQYKKAHENPPIGIILCKSADKTFVEYAVRDFDKPMGVATYKTAAEMPENLKRALPSIEELRQQLIDSDGDE
jgi:hypothetical protein